MAASTLADVELGFVEEINEKWRLSSHFFPSKVGGKPSWLALKNLPAVTDFQCGKCGKPCVFVLQVYCPIVDTPECFHRTIFLFICRDSECSQPNDNRNIVALRSQLGRENEFYCLEAPDDSVYRPECARSAETHRPLCAVCGCLGPKQCAQCHRASYCSKDHQTIDWKSGHKQACSSDNPPSSSPNQKLLFPEYDLVTEPENYRDEQKREKSEADKMQEYRECLDMLKGKGTLLEDKDAAKDLEKMASSEQGDEQFLKFKERIDHEPEQVLRYQRGGQPLWASTEHQPTSNEIPKCSCGAERILEFQVMPQLLIHLNADRVGSSIDWGTLAIYTCTVSCQSQGYQREFVWKQDYSGDRASDKKN